MNLVFSGQESYKEQPKSVLKIPWDEHKTAHKLFDELPERRILERQEMEG